MTTSPWTYVIGPFFGAMLAFALARMYDASRRFYEHVAAANLALMTLKNQYNDFLQFRMAFAQDCARLSLTGDEPVWSLLRPSHMRYGDYEFDFVKIAFLFESGIRPAVFEAIELAQITHRDLLKLDEQRTDTARDTQRQVAKELTEQKAGLADAEKVLGKAYVAELDMLVVGLALRACDSEHAYIQAFKELRAALREHIMQTWRYRVGYLWRMRHDDTVEDMLVKMNERLSPGFNADELPAFPDSLQARVNSVFTERKALKAALAND
jgi:hypothetical protein